MTKKTTYICDRCGEEEKRMPVSLVVKDEGKTNQYKKEPHDLCSKCAKSFQLWLGEPKATEKEEGESIR